MCFASEIGKVGNARDHAAGAGTVGDIVDIVVAAVVTVMFGKVVGRYAPGDAADAGATAQDAPIVGPGDAATDAGAGKVRVEAGTCKTSTIAAIT